MNATMRSLARLGKLAGTGCEFAAGVVLIAIMVLTGADIVGRAFGSPIPGTYEIVSFAGGLVIGLAMPVTSWVRGHVYVDLVTAHVPRPIARVLHVATRAMGIVLFALLAWALVRMGVDLRASGEATAVLGLPSYPVAWVLAGAFLVACASLAYDASSGEPQRDG